MVSNPNQFTSRKCFPKSIAISLKKKTHRNSSIQHLVIAIGTPFVFSLQGNDSTNDLNRNFNAQLN